MNKSLNAVKHFSRGDRTISASSLNAMLDSLRKLASDHESKVVGRMPQGQQQWVKNVTGDVVSAFQVLGIGPSIYDPDADVSNPDEVLPQWYSTIVVEGETPDAETHAGKWVITLEEIEDQGIGRCMYMGIVPAKIRINDSSHSYVDADDTTTTLQTVKRGRGEIIWRSAETGDDVWAIIRFPSWPDDRDADESSSSDADESSSSESYSSTSDSSLSSTSGSSLSSSSLSSSSQTASSASSSQSGGSGGGYIDIGSDQYDSLTCDESWYTLDISSSVPADATAILVSVDSDDSWRFRYPGSSDTVSTALAGSSRGFCVIPCAGQEIDYYCGFGGYLTIYIKGYWL